MSAKPTGTTYTTLLLEVQELRAQLRTVEAEQHQTLGIVAKLAYELAELKRNRPALRVVERTGAA